MGKPRFRLLKRQFVGSNSHEDRRVGAPNPLWVWELARQTPRQHIQDAPLFFDGIALFDQNLPLANLASKPTAKFTASRALGLDLARTLRRTAKSGAEPPERVTESKFSLRLGQTQIFCNFLPGIASLPCHPDRTCPVIHVLDGFLDLNRTIQIRHPLRIVGMLQPLKIAAQRKIFHHLSPSAFPPQGAIEAMVKDSEEIGLQVQYRPAFSI